MYLIDGNVVFKHIDVHWLNSIVYTIRVIMAIIMVIIIIIIMAMIL